MNAAAKYLKELNKQTCQPEGRVNLYSYVSKWVVPVYCKKLRKTKDLLSLDIP